MVSHCWPSLTSPALSPLLGVQRGRKGGEGGAPPAPRIPRWKKREVEGCADAVVALGRGRWREVAAMVGGCVRGERKQGWGRGTGVGKGNRGGERGAAEAVLDGWSGFRGDCVEAARGLFSGAGSVPHHVRSHSS